jgi:hypothetical protein
MTNDTSDLRGACHCGVVTFSVKGPITRAVRCTCSICSTVGAVWHGTDESGLKILTGEGDLALYQFGTKTAKHYFCRHCGVHPFSRPRLNPQLWAVNLRCVPGVDAAALPTSVFDGAHWEEAAHALRSRARPSAG